MSWIYDSNFEFNQDQRGVNYWAALCRDICSQENFMLPLALKVFFFNDNYSKALHKNADNNTCCLKSVTFNGSKEQLSIYNTFLFHLKWTSLWHKLALILSIESFSLPMCGTGVKCSFKIVVVVKPLNIVSVFLQNLQFLWIISQKFCN